MNDQWADADVGRGVLQQEKYGPVTGLEEANCEVRQVANGTWVWTIYKDTVHCQSAAGYPTLEDALWAALRQATRDAAFYRGLSEREVE